MNQMRPSSPQGGTGFSLLDSHVGMSQNSVPKTTQGLFMVIYSILLSGNQTWKIPEHGGSNGDNDKWWIVRFSGYSE